MATTLYCLPNDPIKLPAGVSVRVRLGHRIGPGEVGATRKSVGWQHMLLEHQVEVWVGRVESLGPSPVELKGEIQKA